jgi:hypothetical protein
LTLNELVETSVERLDPVDEPATGLTWLIMKSASAPPEATVEVEKAVETPPQAATATETTVEKSAEAAPETTSPVVAVDYAAELDKARAAMNTLCSDKEAMHGVFKRIVEGVQQADRDGGALAKQAISEGAALCGLPDPFAPVVKEADIATIVSAEVQKAVAPLIEKLEKAALPTPPPSKQPSATSETERTKQLGRGVFTNLMFPAAS